MEGAWELSDESDHMEQLVLEDGAHGFEVARLGEQADLLELL